MRRSTYNTWAAMGRNRYAITLRCIDRCPQRPTLCFKRRLIEDGGRRKRDKRSVVAEPIEDKLGIHIDKVVIRVQGCLRIVCHSFVVKDANSPVQHDNFACLLNQSKLDTGLGFATASHLLEFPCLG